MIFDGLDGICKVRFNRGGKLLVPHGYVGALQLALAGLAAGVYLITHAESVAAGARCASGAASAIDARGRAQNRIFTAGPG